MLSNQASIQKIAFPLEDNQFLNNTTQINNYYLNLTHNLNLNNFDENKISKYPINPNLNMLNLNNQNTNENLSKLSFVNTFININNFISLLQMQESFKSYQELLVSNNGPQKGEKSAEITPKIIGIKRNREEFGNNDTNNNHDKNLKIIINEKNGNYSKKKKTQVIFEKNKFNKKRNVKKIIKAKNNNNTNYIQSFGPTIEIDLTNKNKNEISNDLKINENEIKNKDKKKCNKKLNRYKELLQDTILENLDKEKNDLEIIINNTENQISSNSQRSKKVKKLKTEKILKRPKPCTNNKYKTKTIKNSRAKTIFTSEKNNKHDYIRYQSTKCIFHGDKYKNTNLSIDFMKYNYNFIEEIKQPKKSDNKIKHILNIKIPNIISENNYENHINNLSELKPIWLRSKFKGNDKELNKSINLIKNKCKDGRDDINEEKCLEKLMEMQNNDLKDN